MRVTRFLAVVGVFAALPRLGVAQDAKQSRTIELGMDAAVVRETSDFTETTSLTLPVSRFRVGFFLGNAVSIEPSIALAFGRQTIKSTITQDDVTNSGTSYDLDLGLLYHFGTDRSKTQPYVRPFVGIRGFSNSSDNDQFDGSGSQMSYGAGVGIKTPFANRLGGRIELGYGHQAENEPEFSSSNRIFLSFGLSFFAR